MFQQDAEHPMQRFGRTTEQLIAELEALLAGHSITQVGSVVETRRRIVKDAIHAQINQLARLFKATLAGV